MSYESYKKQSMHNTIPDEWQPSCCINPCIQLHNSLLWPASNGPDCDNCVWYVMNMNDKELDMDKRGSWAIYTQN